MNPWEIITSIFKPAADVVDALHTSEEERLQVKAKLFELQTQLTSKMLDYEARLVEAQTKVISAEAQGESWLQRCWRPITMLTFLGLVVLDTLGLTAFRLSQEAWTLLQIGLGGYVVGRSAEKIVPKVTDVMRKD